MRKVRIKSRSERNKSSNSSITITSSLSTWFRGSSRSRRTSPRSAPSRATPRTSRTRSTRRRFHRCRTRRSRSSFSRRRRLGARKSRHDILCGFLLRDFTDQATKIHRVDRFFQFAQTGCLNEENFAGGEAVLE